MKKHRQARTIMENIRQARRIAEMYKIEGIVRRYTRRLLLEGFEIAKKKGLEIKLTENPLNFQGEDTISIYHEGEDADTRKLIELAKETHYSLYRRTQNYLDKYSKLCEEVINN